MQFFIEFTNHFVFYYYFEHIYIIDIFVINNFRFVNYTLVCSLFYNIIAWVYKWKN